MESGILALIILTIMGGFIAFIGDKLGTKVGKKRISMFGMRPKHTSILVTIVTGFLIALMTIGVLSVLSENVRVALFGMEELRAKMTSLRMEVQEKSEELEQGKKRLADRNHEYEQVTTRLADANQELDRAVQQQEYMQSQLNLVEAAYAKAKADVATSAAEIKELEKTRTELNDNIAKLNDEAERLRTGIITIREGRVMFRVGEVLSSAVVESGLSQEDAKMVLASVLNDTNELLQERLNLPKDVGVVRIVPDIFEKAVQQVTNSKHKRLVRVVAAGNIIVGEPAWVEFLIYDNELIYNKDEVVLTEDLSKFKDMGSAEARVLRFLNDINREAKKKGVIPDPITGNVGHVEGQELFNTMQEVTKLGGNVILKAVAKEDIYTEGPVSIHIVVIPK